MLLSTDVVVTRQASCAVANLLESPELHQRFMMERGLPPLVALSSSADRVVKGQSIRALANLAVNADAQLAMLAEGIVLPLIDALVLDDVVDNDMSQGYAALCLANLATTSLLQVKVVQAGISQRLVDLCSKGSEEAKRYSCLALANLTAATANHSVLLEAGALAAIYALANSRDTMSQFYAGCSLANLVRNRLSYHPFVCYKLMHRLPQACATGNHMIMCEEGGLQPIITLAYCPVGSIIIVTHVAFPKLKFRALQDPDVHQQAAAALRGLSWSKFSCEKVFRVSYTDAAV